MNFFMYSAFSLAGVIIYGYAYSEQDWHPVAGQGYICLVDVRYRERPPCMLMGTLQLLKGGRALIFSDSNVHHVDVQ